MDYILEGRHLWPTWIPACAGMARNRPIDVANFLDQVQAIIAERRGISGDTALRLARYFATTPEFWLNMQRDYELEMAAEALGSRRS